MAQMRSWLQFLSPNCENPKRRRIKYAYYFSSNESLAKDSAGMKYMNYEISAKAPAKNSIKKRKKKS